MSETKRADLIDRQSVRTTFRFSEEAIEALGWLSKRYGLPMKDVLDYEMDREIWVHEFFKETDILELSKESDEEAVPRKIENNTPVIENKLSLAKTVRRTLVVTKKTLKNLKKLSDETNLTRDEILNKAIIDGKMSTEAEDECQIEKYNKALKIINEFIDEAHNIETKVKEVLDDDDDHIVNGLWMAIHELTETSTKIEDEINKREKISQGS
jgi:hypothetical protein